MKRMIAFLLMILLFCSSCSTLADQKTQIGDDGLPNEMPEAVAVKIVKDPNIKEEQRELFFDVAQEHRFDALPEIRNGQQPELDWMKWYVVYVCGKDSIIQTPDGPFLSTEDFNRVVNGYFDFNYDLGDAKTIPLEIGGLNGVPFVELVAYKEEVAENGETLVTARFVQYSNDPLSWAVDPETEYPEEYANFRYSIVTGQADQADASNITEIQYYTQDGINPTRIISAVTSSRGTNGFITPEGCTPFTE